MDSTMIRTTMRLQSPPDQGMSTTTATTTNRIRLGSVLVLLFGGIAAPIADGFSSVKPNPTYQASGCCLTKNAFSASYSCLTRQRHFLFATIERTRGVSSTYSSDDDDEEEIDDEDDEYDDEGEELKLTALDGDLKSGGTGKSGNKKRKPRADNPAMQDVEFLRKRTNDLLKLTELMVQSNGRPLDADDSTNQLSLGRQMKVDKKTFHFLLDAWAFSNENDAPEQAKKLLAGMVDLSKINNKYHQLDMQPDVRSYTKTINAIARHASPNAGHEAEQILVALKERYQNQKNPEAAALLKPNSYTYTAVIQAHCNSGAPGSAEIATEWIEKMVDKYQRGDDEVQPTAKAFNAILCAYGKAGQADQAQEIFNRMEQLYSSGGMNKAKPNAFHYNALISAYAQHSDAQQAERVLEKMQELYRTTQDPDVKPTTVSFNTVIDGYAKSGEDGAAQKAEQVLHNLSNTYDLYVARPNTRSFNSVINAWAKSGDVDAALKSEQWLDVMEKRYEEGDLDVRPDVHSFATVINAHARSEKPDKAERAYNLYKEMEKLYKAGNNRVRPNIVAVNAVMNACAFTTGDIRYQNRAVEIAHSILKSLEQSPYGISPDQVTYGTFLKVCANQMPDSHTRQQIVEALFKKCCRDGKVGNFVLQQLKTLATSELYKELVGRGIDESTQMEDLPKEWWCNVVEGKWRRRRPLLNQD